MAKTPRKILLAITHGLKSYGVLSLLQKQGHQVTTIHFTNKYISTLNGINPSFAYFCSTEIETKIQQQLKPLKIPYITHDLSSDFSNIIFPRWQGNIELGTYFDPFYEYTQLIFSKLLEIKKANNFDLISSGHYARIREVAKNRYQILPAIEHAKDQSYLFCEFPASSLSSFFMPVGDLRSEHIKKVALEYFQFKDDSLPTYSPEEKREFFALLDEKQQRQHKKQEKQISTKSTLSHMVKVGPIVLKPKNKLVGEHEGLAHHNEGDILEGKHYAQFGEVDTDYAIVSKNFINNQLAVFSTLALESDESPYFSITCQSSGTQKQFPTKPMEVFVRCNYTEGVFHVKVYPKIYPYFLIRPLGRFPALPRYSLLTFYKGKSHAEGINLAARLLNYEFAYGNTDKYPVKIWC